MIAPRAISRRARSRSVASAYRSLPLAFVVMVSAVLAAHPGRAQNRVSVHGRPGDSACEAEAIRSLAKSAPKKLPPGLQERLMRPRLGRTPEYDELVNALMLNKEFANAAAQSIRGQNADCIRQIRQVRFDRGTDAGVAHASLSSNRQPTAVQHAVNQVHANCFVDDPFPSARVCKTCHPGHYREWSVSSHAYAQLSPVFNAMSGELNRLTSGTLGDFCIRCHTPVGMALDEKMVMSNMDRHPTAREGVTCVVCHRINQNWGKGAGRQALVAGGLTEPIYGPFGGEILAAVLDDPERFGVMRTEDDAGYRGRAVHGDVVPFFALTAPSSCGSCHDVFAPNGFRLEDAFSEFKSSPSARKKGETCQDCHMGVEPGVASGYAFAAAAQVGNAATPARKRTNHMFIGPDYSIVHPGIFPHNPDAVREEHADYALATDEGLATMRQWLEFDHRAGWGTFAFEDNIPGDYDFPAAWDSKARRFRARRILNDQFALLREAKVARHQILSTGYQLGEVELKTVGRRSVTFTVPVWNGTDGHGVPTGFDAERLVFLRVMVWDTNGRLVFLSGDLDPNGDVRDSHSFYVHNGELPLDRQLFSLQSRFITRNIRGGEREQILNVPFSLDPLPFIRPETRPYTVLGRPVGARKHKQNIAPGGSVCATYKIQRCKLSGAGPYQVKVQLIAGMVPVNLVHAISHAGFDYNLSAKEVGERVVDGHLILHERDAVLRIDE